MERDESDNVESNGVIELVMLSDVRKEENLPSECQLRTAT